MIVQLFRVTVGIALWNVIPLLGSGFLPLQSGNTWIYRSSTTAEEFTIRVGAPMAINERTYYPLSGYTDSTLLVRFEGDLQLLYLDENTGREELLSLFEQFEGGWWVAPFRLCTDLGQTLVARGVHDGPAGPFNNVLQVRYRPYGCADAGLTAEQYTENIGMLRRTQTTIAGPRDFDLVYAKVGTMVIDARPYGSFTASVEDLAGSTSLMISLRVAHNSAHPLDLTFPTTQEYDIRLQDSQGRIVYTWSADKAFAQMVQQESIAGEWIRTVAIPRPFPGEYVLEAWLTSNADSPRFATALPITIGSPEQSLRTQSPRGLR